MQVVIPKFMIALDKAMNDTEYFNRTKLVQEKVIKYLETDYASSLSEKDREDLILASKLIQADLIFDLPNEEAKVRIWKGLRGKVNETVVSLVLLNEFYLRLNREIPQELTEAIEIAKQTISKDFNRKKALNILTYATTIVKEIDGELKELNLEEMYFEIHNYWGATTPNYYKIINTLMNMRSILDRYESQSKDLVVIDAIEENLTSANIHKVRLLQDRIRTTKYENVYFLTKKQTNEEGRRVKQRLIQLEYCEPIRLKYEDEVDGFFPFGNELDIVTFALDKNNDEVMELYLNSPHAVVLTELCDVSTLKEVASNYTSKFINRELIRV